MSALNYISDKQPKKTLIADDTLVFRNNVGNEWIGEPIFDPGYEFSCDHCGTEMEDSVTGYWKNDNRYCALCAWDLFDQPEPISAYDIWKQEKDEKMRQEDERRRVREEREEQERQHMREREEEMEEYRAWREEQDAERKKSLPLLWNILAKQESARIQERDRLREELHREQDEQERMDNENYDVLLSPVIENFKYEFECCYCGIEMEKTDGFTINDDRYCTICACELEAQESNHLTCEYTDDPKNDYDSLQPNEFWNTSTKHPIDDYDWLKANELRKNTNQCVSLSSLPGSVEELYEYLDEQLKPQEVSIIPQDAFKLDEEFIYCETYDEAKDVLSKATFTEHDTVQNLHNIYIVSQHNDRFWYALSPVQDNPNKFNISLFASKDEVATKYLIRQLEECVYNIDYILNPDDYPQGEEEAVASLDATEEDADHYLKNQDPCFMCNEYNYANVMFDAGRMRIICRDCYPKVRQCYDCDTLTKDPTCYNFDTGLRLCFDCNFKTEERVQMPLEEHLLVRRDIQHLRPQYFDVLVDYSELAEFTIFDAYRYKSKCHFYDCIQRISPSGWNAEETLHFCSRRHSEYADELGCHCHNVYDGRDYDDDYEEATCKICNSPHEANVASRKALRQSGQGVKPIVSAICMFEEICMSNVLFTSLVELSQYFM